MLLLTAHLEHAKSRFGRVECATQCALYRIVDLGGGPSNREGDVDAVDGQAQAHTLVCKLGDVACRDGDGADGSGGRRE